MSTFSAGHAASERAKMVPTSVATYATPAGLIMISELGLPSVAYVPKTLPVLELRAKTTEFERAKKSTPSELTVGPRTEGMTAPGGKLKIHRRFPEDVSAVKLLG